MKCKILYNFYLILTILGKENKTKSGEVTLVLEEAWGLVGANQPHKRGKNFINNCSVNITSK